MSHKILILPGDGVGPEIVTEAVKLLDALQQAGELAVELEHADVGGVAVDGHGSPLPETRSMTGPPGKPSSRIDATLSNASPAASSIV